MYKACLSSTANEREVMTCKQQMELCKQEKHPLPTLRSTTHSSYHLAPVSQEQNRTLRDVTSSRFPCRSHLDRVTLQQLPLAMCSRAVALLQAAQALP